MGIKTVTDGYLRHVTFLALWLAAGFCQADFEAGEKAFREGLYEVALNRFQESAAEGYPPAQYHLGFMYDKGLGVKKDHAVAAIWYTRAAQQGYAYAQNNLAELYRQGLGVKKDLQQAAKWYREAARRGILNAQFSLAEMYRRGQGIKKDLRLAEKWLLKAAERGYTDAQTELGLMYYHGKDVKRNYIQAAKWFKRAANQGHVKAQHMLGLFYMQGIGGLGKNRIRAFVWLSLAARQDQQSGEYLRKLRRSLSDKELSKANSILARYTKRF